MSKLGTNVGGYTYTSQHLSNSENKDSMPLMSEVSPPFSNTDVHGSLKCVSLQQAATERIVTSGSLGGEPVFNAANLKPVSDITKDDFHGQTVDTSRVVFQTLSTTSGSVALKVEKLGQPNGGNISEDELDDFFDKKEDR